MISLKSQGGSRTILPVRHIWFADTPKKRDALYPTIFFHAKSLQDQPGFERRSRWTSLIRIDCNESELLDSFSRNTRYKINRAIREESEVRFNHVEPSRGSKDRAKPKDITYDDNLITTTAILSCNEQVSHRYLVDQRLKRVHMYASSSRYQDIQDTDLRNRIARINRLLHYKDMILFRDKGFQYYDFGGIANAKPGSKLGNIDNLKMGFRGKLVEESIFVSRLIIWYNAIIHKQSTRV
jgi:hypothetical protein